MLNHLHLEIKVEIAVEATNSMLRQANKAIKIQVPTHRRARAIPANQDLPVVEHLNSTLRPVVKATKMTNSIL
jgi:hypothetical protein